MRRNLLFSALAAAALLAACGRDHTFVDGGGGGGPAPAAPTNLTTQPRWILEGFTAGGQPSGYAAVDLAWDPPAAWSNEVFRVYGRRAGGSSFFLIATVTSCTTSGCVYRDRNVTAGQTYEYYVATTNESSNQETATQFRETVSVPSASIPATPLADSAVALDNAAYLRWRDGGAAGSLWKYVVYLTRIDGTAYLYGLGETDGAAFLDTRATNGHVYGYRVAAVDTMEHVSALSAEFTVAPRPDASGELVNTFQTNAALSGFRFQASEATDPVLAGTATGAQWRLERDGTGWHIVPLNGTSVIEYPGGRTTALACGPGSDANCRAVTRAPVAGYQTTPIAVNPEFSYVFRVTGSDGQPHYGVIRVQLLGSDGAGHDLMIFDWAYQTLPNEPRLDRAGTGSGGLVPGR
ncbi:hypothetical protein SAMN05216486_10124 [bacterium JGI 053]|nr:hypothetical protein SAMN05216486_10124 [bacterium JGI 053]